MTNPQLANAAILSVSSQELADRNAITERYSATVPILGVYQGNLANSGERLTLSGIDGRAVHSLAFGDRAPWPQAADGSGASLTLVNLDTDNLANPGAWTTSQAPLGTPGAAESTIDAESYADWRASSFAEAEQADDAISGLTADPDGDGLANIAEYALMTNPQLANAAILSVSSQELTYRQRRHLTEVSVAIQHSTDLITWTNVPEAAITRIANGGDGSETVRWPIDTAAEGYLRLAFSQIE